MLDKITRVLISPKFILTLAGLIVAGTFVAWQYHNVTNVDRVFWGMVDQNLTTAAYSRHTTQKSGAQSVDQVIETQTSPRQVVYSQTVFEQTGVDSATAITENIGTPTHDYVRYKSIATSQKGADGQPLDFSKVLGVWGVTDTPAKGQTVGQQYNQAVLGIIPTGNLTLAQRQELVAQMKQSGAYEYKILETTRTWPFGRPTYTMQVTVKPVAYISVLKTFAGFVGLNHLEDINPQDYASAQQLSFTVSVDGWTHQMTRTDQSQGAKSEAITSRNLRKEMPAVPTDAISVDELQSRLQAVQ